MKNVHILVTALAIIFVMVTSACDGGNMSYTAVTFQSLKDIPESTWEELSAKKVYFGHQSVGFNIIDGLKDIFKPIGQKTSCRTALGSACQFVPSIRLNIL